MATSSIYEDVRIKNRSECRRLVSALESAMNKKGKDVIIPREVQTIKGEKIKELFSK